jgi:hypothetical protein
VTREDRYIECTFLRDAVTTIVTPTDEPEIVTVDLQSIPYHVEIATGPVTEAGQLLGHTVFGLTEAPVFFPDVTKRS